MNSRAIARAAIYLLAGGGCAGELTERPITNDPTRASAAETPFAPPPAYQPDPLLPPLSAESATKRSRVYTCPMHSEVREAQPGKCPKCGMTLVPAAPKDGRQ